MDNSPGDRTRFRCHAALAEQQLGVVAVVRGETRVEEAKTGRLHGTAISTLPMLPLVELFQRGRLRGSPLQDQSEPHGAIRLRWEVTNDHTAQATPGVGGSAPSGTS